jgi:hypothetical protein
MGELKFSVFEICGRGSTWLLGGGGTLSVVWVNF